MSAQDRAGLQEAVRGAHEQAAAHIAAITEQEIDIPDERAGKIFARYLIIIYFSIYF